MKAKLLCFLVIFIVGCSDKGTETPIPSPLLETSWVLSSAPGEPLLSGEAGLTLDFSYEGRISGSVGCNTFGAEIEESSPGSLKIGDVVTTLINCPNSLMEAEQRYLYLMGQFNRYSITESVLTMYWEDGENSGELHFIPRQIPLFGSSWGLTDAPGVPGLSENDGIVLSFSKEGWTVFDLDCNNAGAKVEEPSPGQLIIRVKNVTLMDCSDFVGGPAAVHGSLVMLVNSYSISGNDLILYWGIGGNHGELHYTYLPKN